MNKHDMIIQIDIMIEGMTPVLKEAKAADRLHIHPKAEDLKVGMIKEGLIWIKNIFDKEYRDVKIIKKLLPEEMWVSYKKWECFDEHREVIMLNDALKKLRTLVINRNRPDFFKKGKVDDIFRKAKRKGKNKKNSKD